MAQRPKRYIGLWVSASVLLIIFITLLLIDRKRRREGKGGLIIKGFAKRLADNAEKEWHKWTFPNKIYEGHSAAQPMLRTYWEEGVGSKYKGYTTPWSAAAISYLVKKSGGKDFKYSGAHRDYIIQSIGRKKAGMKTGFLGHRSRDVRPQTGDIICYPRESNVNYDSTHAYQSHCDVVLYNDGDYTHTTGGNLANTFGRNKVALDSNGFIKDKSKYFVIIRKHSL